MRRLGITPNPEAWFTTVGERLNVYSGAADPTVAEVPENQWIVYNNTTVPEVRIWTNIAGVLKKSAAFV
jgi:hypothetical protein